MNTIEEWNLIESACNTSCKSKRKRKEMMRDLSTAYLAVHNLDEKAVVACDHDHHHEQDYDGDAIVLDMMNAHDLEPTAFDYWGGIVGFDGTGGYALWNVDRHLAEGSYWLFCQLTAEESYPLRLWTVSGDGETAKLVADDVASDVTGSLRGEDLRWFHYGPFDLGNVSQVLLDSPDWWWPHVKRFALIPTTTKTLISTSSLTHDVAVDYDLYTIPELVCHSDESDGEESESDDDSDC